MRTAITFLIVLFLLSCASGKEKIFTGSTPAAPIVRSFLGISLSDSIDFIRWKLILQDTRYALHCNYGIGKPNTNGFISGGKKIELKGVLKKENNRYILHHDKRTLKLSELNGDLLHVVDRDNHLLVGNGGWSYTLNNSVPLNTDQVNLIAKPTILKDSMIFEGRTPCDIPGITKAGSNCYKLKWLITLYADPEKNQPGLYKVLGTAWRKEAGTMGNWKMITGKDGRITYQLNDDKGNGFLYLLKLDEGVLIFTDARGKLLTGNEDFSYTLNKRDR